MLLVSVALTGLISLAPEVEGRSLGGLVAHRIACTVGGGCVATATEPARRRPAPAALVPRTRRGAAVGIQGARRVAGTIARRAWIACLGYRRYRYEREHPTRLTQFDRMPVRDALDIANDCLNPFGFVEAGGATRGGGDH